MILGMLDEVGGHPPSLPLLKDSDSENRPTSSRECVFRFYLIPIPCQNLRLWQDSLKALSRKHAVHWGGVTSLYSGCLYFLKLWNICQDVASSIPWSMGASIFTTEGRELNRWSDRLVSAEDWVCVSCLETLLLNARSLQNTQKTPDLWLFTLQNEKCPRSVDISFQLPTGAWPGGPFRQVTSFPCKDGLQEERICWR